MKLNRHRSRNIVLMAASGLMTTLLFQNCSNSSFNASSLDAPSSSLGSTSGNEEPFPSPNPNTEPTPLPDPDPSPDPQPNPTPGFSTLYVARSGSGTVASTPAGINCGSDCSDSFAAGTKITLVATPSQGFVFKGWGVPCSNLNTTCTLNMTAAQNITVSFESTSQLASIDSIIAEMPSNSWKALAGTLMKDVCPTPFNSYACSSVIDAWGGGTYDTKRDRMIILGGGHADSWYNNVFAFDLGLMQWLRLSEMPPESGKIPPLHWKDIRVETCGYYPKGPLTIPPEAMKGNYVDPAKCFEEPIVSQLDFQQPRSVHSYNRIFHDHIKDRYCYLSVGTYPSAQTGTSVVHCFDAVTGLWTRIADKPTNVGGRGQTAMDAKGNMWAVTGSSGPIGEYDPINNTWKTHGFLNSDALGGMDIDRQRQHMYVLVAKQDGAHLLRRFDLNSATSLNAKPPYSEITATKEAPLNLGAAPGFVYADDKDRFYAWGGGRHIFEFNPTTKVWKQLSATGDDPGPQARWGTYGRFRYSSARKVFVVVNSINQNVFIYKP